MSERGFSPEAQREAQEMTITESLIRVIKRLSEEGRKVLLAAAPALVWGGSAHAEEPLKLESEQDGVADLGELPTSVRESGFSLDLVALKSGAARSLDASLRLSFRPTESGFAFVPPTDLAMNTAFDGVPAAVVSVEGATDEEGAALRREALKKTAKDVMQVAMETKNIRMTTLNDTQYYGWKFHVPIDERNEMFVTPYVACSREDGAFSVDGVFVKIDIEEIRPGRVSPWKIDAEK